MNIRRQQIQVQNLRHPRLLPPQLAWRSYRQGQQDRHIQVLFYVIPEDPRRHPLAGIDGPQLLADGPAALLCEFSTTITRAAWRHDDDTLVQLRPITEALLLAGLRPLLEADNLQTPIPLTPELQKLELAFSQIITAHCRDPAFNAEALLASSGLSPSHARAKFRHIFNESPANHLQRERLRLAAHLLRDNPNEPIETIALRCGFKTLPHFSRLFKHAYGTTASRWRRGDD